ncbi:hypothetical protein E6Q11_02545 [Candidatus Dojkabacteria bacterium]|uniref:Uncharacterized protein n=1 Tax=Candidatus Dojkabacteria bacterium TaxID=2099670 RepID=A0A5C7J8P0_9BACT|nr:MAG: hypothetical protein E6Q11_02545 [Candidatus Dojkabacteria bacterium]
MASEVEMCNRALQKLGAQRITSLSENSVNARACSIAYPVIRDREQEEHFWNFTIERATLAADATAPAWGRNNSFELPADFLKLAPDYPEDNFNSKDWQIEGRKILTNDSAPLYVRYVKQVTDPNLMPPLFRETVSAALAMELAEELTQSNTKKEAVKADYEDMIARAKKSNAIQNVPQMPATDSWITERD